MKFRSISTRVIAYFVVLVVLFTGLLAGVGYYFSQSSIEQEVDKGLIGLAQESARHVRAELEIAIAFMKSQSERQFVRDNSLSREDKISLYHKAATLGGFYQFVIADSVGNAFLSTGDQVDISDRDYFVRGMSGEEVVSDVLIHKLTGEPVITIAVPIYTDGEITGVMVGVKNATFLSNITDNITFGETGYAYLVNGEGVVRAHPDRKNVLEELNLLEHAKQNDLHELASLLENKMLQSTTDVGTYFYNGRDVKVGFTPVENTDWVIVASVPKKEAMAGASSLLRRMLLIGLVAIVIGSVVAVFLSRSITRPIAVLSGVIERLSNYDLTFDESSEAVSYLERRDEIGTITNALAKMQRSFIELIKNTAGATEQVAASSEELMAAGEELTSTSEEVGRTVEEIAAGSSSQARDTEEGALQANQLGSLIATSVEQISVLEQSSHEITSLQDEGMQIVNELVTKTRTSSEAAKEITEIIRETDRRAADIAEASNMIKGIADQTNMLALNAAIEAARAGEAGSGFAVVADEIRSLSEQSNKFANEISRTIEELTRQTQYAVKKMIEIGNVVASQNESVNMTNDKFEGIANAIERTVHIVKNLAQSGTKMNQKREQIITVLESLSAIAEENAAGTQQASAAMEEQIASIQQMTRASEQLAKLAEEVQNNISKFRY